MIVAVVVAFVPIAIHQNLRRKCIRNKHTHRIIIIELFRVRLLYRSDCAECELIVKTYSSVVGFHTHTQTSHKSRLRRKKKHKVASLSSLLLVRIDAQCNVLFNQQKKECVEQEREQKNSVAAAVGRVSVDDVVVRVASHTHTQNVTHTFETGFLPSQMIRETQCMAKWECTVCV